MKKDAYYFSHDSNAKDDPKCIMLIEQLGLEGYGIFWVLIETLRDQPNYCYPLNLLPALARRFNTTAEKMRVVVTNYALFTVTDDNFFHSDSLKTRMEIFEQKRELQRAKANKRWGNVEQKTIPQQCHGITTALPRESHGNASKVKERKVKESKVKESKVNNNILKESIEDESLREETKKQSSQKIEKILFDEFVKMTQAEYDKLVEKHGEVAVRKMIEKLNNYKCASGKTYKSDYHAILTWVADQIKRDIASKPRQTVYKDLTHAYE